MYNAAIFQPICITFSATFILSLAIKLGVVYKKVFVGVLFWGPSGPSLVVVF